MTRFDWLADVLRQIERIVPIPWPDPCLTCPPDFLTSFADMFRNLLADILVGL